jgi:putative transposase
MASAVEQACTAAKIAEVTGDYKRHIARRAARESWPYVVGARQSKLFLVERLPGDVKDMMIAHMIEQAADMVPVAEGKGIERVNSRKARIIPFNNIVLAGSRVPAVAAGSDAAAGNAGGDHGQLPAPGGGTDVQATLGSESIPATLDGETLPVPGHLAGWQRDVMDARCVLLNALDDYTEAAGSLSKAIRRMVKQSQTDTLPSHLAEYVPVAKMRSGQADGDMVLSRRTLFRWRELRQIGVTALAPKARAKYEIPAWAPYFLKCYRRPQKPSVPEALEDMAQIVPAGMALPSESQCYRFLKKVSRVDRERGRRTGNELLSVMPMRRRSTEDLNPMDVVTCDGHTFKARVAHPAHGRPFAPEVCAVMDAATRRIIGWSCGLAESAETVADALRHAIQQTGIPLIFYTDPGSGNTAHVNSHPAFGRYARMGITFKTGLPGRTQARGMVERLQQSCWIRAAKKLPTYKGNGMDGVTLHKATRLLDKDIRQTGQSDKLMPWEDFVRFCGEYAVASYNSRPHTSLPKVTDPETGRRRHMTPDEMWQSFTDAGWQPEKVTEHEIADMFRPRKPKPVTTRRGEVNLFGNIYFDPELKHYTGEKVIVEYEPQDGGFVYVRDLDEHLICRAKFNRNKDSYFPKSAIEEAADRRAKARAKLKEQQLEEIELERRGSVTIDVDASPDVIEARRLALEMCREDEAACRTDAQDVGKMTNQVTQQTTYQVMASTPEPAPEPETTPAPAPVSIPTDDLGKWHLWKKLDQARQSGDGFPEGFTRFYESFQKTHTWAAFYEVEQDLGGYDLDLRAAK